MEKQTDGRLRYSKIDNVGEYNDQFLQLRQNNGIYIHLKIGKHGVATKMNRFLLEKVRCLLSNAQLDKSF